MLLIGAPFAKMVRMDDNAHPCPGGVLQDCLPNPCCPVDDYGVTVRQLQAGYQIAYQFLLRANQPVWELVRHDAVIGYLLIGHCPIFMKKPALV